MVRSRLKPRTFGSGAWLTLNRSALWRRRYAVTEPRPGPVGAYPETASCTRSRSSKSPDVKLVRGAVRKMVSGSEPAVSAYEVAPNAWKLKPRTAPSRPTFANTL